MSQLTKNQHNVPAFYLRQWRKIGTENVVCHDLKDERSFEVSPDKILVERYFYEEERENPDNRIENILASMEGFCSQHFSILNSLSISPVRSTQEKAFINKVKNALSQDTCKAIKTFAAYQYLRIPGAIDQKRYELTTTVLTEAQKDHLLNAGRFVDSGFDYIKERFLSLKILVLMSTGQDFITSDWPCFDMKDSDSSPLLGEEIGKKPEVVAYYPLTPRLGVVFYPETHAIHVGSHRMPEAHVVACPDSTVRNHNTLVIQQADRFVVANSHKEFIFKVAKKRKKSNVDNRCDKRN